MSVALVAAAACGMWGVRRAPLDELPEDMDVESRMERMEEMTYEYPEDAHLRFTLANLYYEQALPIDAIRNYHRALEVDPDLNKARVNLAMVLAESGDPDSAKVLLHEAIERDPEDSKAYSNLGMIYYTDLDVAKAVMYFTKALEIDPDSLEAHYNLGLAFAESGLLLEAIREWRLVADADPQGDTGQRALMALQRVEQKLQR
jgi:tetratricopeptide (TPR) repeat protein